MFDSECTLAAKFFEEDRLSTEAEIESGKASFLQYVYDNLIALKGVVTGESLSPSLRGQAPVSLEANLGEITREAGSYSNLF